MALQDEVQDYFHRVYITHWGVSLYRLLEIQLMARNVLVMNLQQQVVSEEHLGLDC